MKDTTVTNGVMAIINDHNQRITRLENLNIKIIEQTAHQNAQFDALSKQINAAATAVSDKMDVMSEHLTEKIDIVDCKVKGLESGFNRSKIRLEELEDKQKVKDGIFKFLKKYIFPVFTAVGSVAIERFFFHGGHH